jgi:hypothetical protein
MLVTDSSTKARNSGKNETECGFFVELTIFAALGE